MSHHPKNFLIWITTNSGTSTVLCQGKNFYGLKKTFIIVWIMDRPLIGYDRCRSDAFSVVDDFCELGLLRRATHWPWHGN
jgi:hypothetical protein